MSIKSKKNIFYAQSGGVTPVINATAKGIYDEFIKNRKYFGKLFIGKNGIAGALNEEIIDIEKENKTESDKLIHTPGGAFGSCRIKLKDPKTDQDFRIFLTKQYIQRKIIQYLLCLSNQLK